MIFRLLSKVQNHILDLPQSLLLSTNATDTNVLYMSNIFEQLQLVDYTNEKLMSHIQKYSWFARYLAMWNAKIMGKGSGR